MSTNLTAATATAIASLPYSITQDVSDSAGPNYYVWFTYTARTAEIIIGVWASAPIASNYDPAVAVYTGTPSSLTQWLAFSGSITYSNRPIQIPMTAGTTYYFRVGAINAPGPPSAPLTLSVIPQPAVSSAPAGSILITDDQTGFPASIISPTTGEVLGFVNLPPGEAGTILPNGLALVQNKDNGKIELYSAALALLATPAVISTNTLTSISSNRLDRFYVGNPGIGSFAKVTAVSSTGAVIRTWNLPTAGLNGQAPTRDNTILYHIGQASTVEAPVKRWDLVNDVALPDLAPAIAGTRVTKDVLVFPDGSVVVGYTSHPGEGTSYVKRYSAAGAVLNTYAIAGAADHLHHHTDELSFWVWIQQDDTHTWQRIHLASGEVLQTVTGPIFETGAITGDSTDTPAGRFGASSSCPLMITQVPVSVERTKPTPPTTTSSCPCPPANEGPPTGASGGNPGGDGFEPDAELDTPPVVTLPPEVLPVPPDCSPSELGTVMSYPVASAGESMAGVREDRMWVEIAFDDDPAYWSVDVGIPSVPGAPSGTDGRLFGLSGITRGMSDENGNFTGTKVTLTLNDKDRAGLRTRLGSSASKYVWDREGVGRIASEANRRAGYTTPPRELFRGLSRDITLESKFNGAITFEDRLVSQFGAFGPDRSFSSRLLTLGLFPGCPKELVGKPQQWILGDVSDEGATDPATGEPSSKGLVPLWLVGSIGSEDEYHLCGHAISCLTLYGSDGGVDDEPAKRVKLTSGYRVELFHVTDSVTGEVHAVTHVFLPSGSIPSEDHKRGTVTLAANVRGALGMNGRTITQLFLQYQYVFEHIVLPRLESLSGAYGPTAVLPYWSDGRAMIHSESFARAQAYSAERIGGTGYLGGFVLGGPGQGAVSLRELLRRFSDSGDCWFSWTSGGQLRVVLLDDAQAVSGSPHITEPAGLRAFPTPSFAFEEVENPVAFAYDYDDDRQKFRVAQEIVQDENAMTRMGRPRPSPTPVAMRCVRDATTAKDVAARRLLRRKYPPAYCPVVEPIDGLDRDPGDVIRITSQEGVGSGSTERALWIRETTFDQKSRRCTHLTRDLTDILASAAFWQSEVGSEALWADDDDTIGDGVTLAQEWR